MNDNHAGVKRFAQGLQLVGLFLAPAVLWTYSSSGSASCVKPTRLNNPNGLALDKSCQHLYLANYGGRPGDRIRHSAKFL